MDGKKVEWTNEMSVGDKHLDEQHKQILDKISELKEELADGIKLGVVKETVDFFEKYFMEHLVDEEKYMEEHNYPKLEQHKKFHQEFIDYATGFRNDFNYKYVLGSPSENELKKFLGESEKFFENWWINHIMTEDQKYEKYILEHEGE